MPKENHIFKKFLDKAKGLTQGNAAASMHPDSIKKFD
jgi:hypothetical protein